MVALHLGAAQGPHDVELRLGFDTFGGGRIAEAVAQGGDRPQDRQGAHRRRKLADEGAVDLDLVERESMQIGERRISRAEIIHRNADAHGATRRA
jgi:hypothetical protein